MFDQHVQEETEAKAGLQEACIPRRYSPPAGVAVRGTLMYFHGFSACPQQLWAYALNLSSSGYHVLLPLLPGHGRNFNGTANGTSSDHIEDLPKQDYCGRYQMNEYVRRMTEIMERAPADRVVGGLSLGGTYALAAVQLKPALFSRQLVMVPLLGSPVQWKGLIVIGWSFLPWVNQKLEGWGPGCLVERSKGRGGICTFTISNLGAALTFAMDTLRGAQQLSGGNFTSQIMGHEGDTAASPAAMIQVAKAISGSADGNADGLFFCVNNNNTLHSMISTYDTPEIDRSAYLPELFGEMTAFIVGAAALPTDGSFADGMRECSVMKGWDYRQHNRTALDDSA